jgi:hypothetical protein
MEENRIKTVGQLINGVVPASLVIASVLLVWRGFETERENNCGI